MDITEVQKYEVLQNVSMCIGELIELQTKLSDNKKTFDVRRDFSQFQIDFFLCALAYNKGETITIKKSEVYYVPS